MPPESDSTPDRALLAERLSRFVADDWDDAGERAAFVAELTQRPEWLRELAQLLATAGGLRASHLAESLRAWQERFDDDPAALEKELVRLEKEVPELFAPLKDAATDEENDAPVSLPTPSPGESPRRRTRGRPGLLAFFSASLGAAAALILVVLTLWLTQSKEHPLRMAGSGVPGDDPLVGAVDERIDRERMEQVRERLERDRLEWERERERVEWERLERDRLRESLPRSFARPPSRPSDAPTRVFPPPLPPDRPFVLPEEEVPASFRGDPDLLVWYRRFEPSLRLIDDLEERVADFKRIARPGEGWLAETVFPGVIQGFRQEADAVMEYVLALPDPSTALEEPRAAQSSLPGQLENFDRQLDALFALHGIGRSLSEAWAVVYGSLPEDPTEAREVVEASLRKKND